MNSPVVSIGLPVYNGERFLERAVESVLAQGFEDWELLISDNGSSDRTMEIARELADRDPRIRVRSFEENRGAVENFDVVFRETEAPFFMWLAHDDWLDPSYLETCHDALVSDDDLVLAFTGMWVVDDTGEPFRSRTEGLRGADSPNVMTRFHSVLWRLVDPTSPVFGLGRRSAFEATGLIRNSNEPDRIFLGEMSLLGGIHEDPRLLFHHYGPPGHTHRDNWAWLNPRNRGRPRFATFRIVYHQWNAIWRSGHPLITKTLMSYDLLVASVVRRTLGKIRAIRRRVRGRPAGGPGPG